MKINKFGETWWQQFKRKYIKGITYWDEIPKKRRLNVDFAFDPETRETSIAFRKKDDSGWDYLTIDELREIKEKRENRT